MISDERLQQIADIFWESPDTSYAGLLDVLRAVKVETIEECAKVCEPCPLAGSCVDDIEGDVSCADAIRALGKSEEVNNV